MRFFKINNLPTKVKKRVISCFLRKREPCLQVLSATTTSPCCPVNLIKPKSVKLAGVPTVKCFLQSLIGPLAGQSCPHRKAWLSSSRLRPPSPPQDLTPRAGVPPAQMPNKCSHPERDTDVFIGLCNQLQSSWRRESQGRRE